MATGSSGRKAPAKKVKAKQGPAVKATKKAAAKKAPAKKAPAKRVVARALPGPMVRIEPGAEIDLATARSRGGKVLQVQLYLPLDQLSADQAEALHRFQQTLGFTASTVLLKSGIPAPPAPAQPPAEPALPDAPPPEPPPEPDEETDPPV